MTRIAYFGGTFDPVHNGHLNVARALLKKFSLDRFYFLPAFHAPHKPDRPPTSGYHRFAMLCLATQEYPDISVSTLELEKGRSRFTIETLPELAAEHPGARTFFVMGADSWADIRTWRDWENVLLSSDHIVVTRPGYVIGLDHVTAAVRSRIIDLRGRSEADPESFPADKRIFLTDAAIYDASATELRDDLSDGHLERVEDIPGTVANYVEKYELYK